jgi:alpha-mannosidase
MSEIIKLLSCFIILSCRRKIYNGLRKDQAKKINGCEVVSMYMLAERIGRILKELKLYTRSNCCDITSFEMTDGNVRYDELQNLDKDQWKPFAKGDRWGGRDKRLWFAASFKVPEALEGRTIVLEVSTGREGDWDALNPQFLAYVNGKLRQGLDVNHREIILSKQAAKGEVFSIDLHAYSGMKEGLVNLDCRVSAVEEEADRLYYDLDVPYNVAILLDEGDKRRIDILGYLNQSINFIDFRKPYSEEFRRSALEADEYLQKEFYAGYCGHEKIKAICVGHTHIDVAWLWTLAQTREKAARSFSTVLSLMKEYPEYRFMSSQPQLYQFVKKDYPALFEEIKERIAEGRWEAEGGMWLEADCNLASGEALVRQLLFGTRFFEKEFGVKNRILWLPDVFGYSAALPQILKKSGIDYFMTTKISWNEYNKIPYDTFLWRGIDGTEVFTYFISTQDYDAKSHFTTYNGDLIPKQVMGTWRRYQQKELTDEVLISYGFGDGGGGPTKEMLENARRMEKGIPGCPAVRQGKALDFFTALEKRASGFKRLPRWVGELYLEYHRGTYTSIARNKKFNRKSELMYQAAELFSVAAGLLANPAAYPQDKLNQGWETILLNQFHDILPGSSIKEVYEDSRRQYLEVLKNGQEILDASFSDISGKITLPSPSVVVFNPLGFERCDLAEFDLTEGYENAEVVDQDGTLLPSQTAGDGKIVFLASGVPSKGYKAFELRKAAPVGATTPTGTATSSGATVPISAPSASTTAAGLVHALENQFFRLRFDESMNILSLFDKRNGREVLKPGIRGNVLQAFEDKPHNYDAWDINIYYQEKMWEVDSVESAGITEAGAVKSTVKVVRRFCDSTITQEISIFNDIPRIDFKTVIDWKETHVLLKAAFPVDIHSDKATYDIQFGNVERPTHWNTSWDQARFEVCAHKWADLSEDGYGVSLLNDCKYGYDIKDGVMRLTLLKSSKEPNPDADREVHEFTYSLYPHRGDFKAAGTVNAAYAFNCPLYAKVENPHEGSLPSLFSLMSVDKENVVLETVKKAEDSGDIVVRLYECYNRRTTVTLITGCAISDAWECDLMENTLVRLSHDENSISFEIQPYEIKTFKLKIK